MTTNNIRLCEPALTLDAEVLRLYNGAFPAAERESVERLSELLAQGKMLCHRTTNEHGELLCFTIVTLADTFSFLAYMATDPNRRSGGIGSKHLQRLLEIIQETYPKHIGLLFEIEATDPEFEDLEEQEKIIRKRRRAFYERAGARVICPDSIYLTVHYDSRDREWEGELMGFEFAGPIISDSLVHVLEQIYMLCYQLPANHPLVLKVLGYFATCINDDAAAELKGSETMTDPELEKSAEDDCGCQARQRVLSSWFSWLFNKVKELWNR
jgi:hypothetical protein